MKKNIGYVCFVGKEVKEKDVINERLLVYKELEDSLRYIRLEDDKTICKVSVTGDSTLTNSKYYGYYDIIIANSIKIEEVLSYDKIVQIMLSDSKNELKLCRFLRSFELNEFDKEEFASKGISTWMAVKYYQDNEKDIYSRDPKALQKAYDKRNK